MDNLFTPLLMPNASPHALMSCTTDLVWKHKLAGHSLSHSGSNIPPMRMPLASAMPTSKDAFSFSYAMPCHFPWDYHPRLAQVLILRANLPFSEDSLLIPLGLLCSWGCPPYTLQALTPHTTHGCLPHPAWALTLRLVTTAYPTMLSPPHSFWTEKFKRKRMEEKKERKSFLHYF